MDLNGESSSSSVFVSGTRKYFLQANDQPIITAEDLPKGKFFWITEELSVTDKQLTLTSECSSGQESPEVVCKTAITTIMNLKVTQIDTRKVKLSPPQRAPKK